MSKTRLVPWVDPQELHYRSAPMGGIRVELHPHNPGWPARYDDEASRISAVLGDRVLLLAHVGSTAVPGLAAKPIIDVVLAVNDSADEDNYAPDLIGLGFHLRIREPDWYEHRLFKGQNEDVNLHVFSKGAAEIERMIRFRDRLRACEDDRRRYEDLKRKLASREWDSIQDYADAKSDVVEEMLTEQTFPGVEPNNRL